MSFLLGWIIAYASGSRLLYPLLKVISLSVHSTSDVQAAQMQ